MCAFSNCDAIIYVIFPSRANLGNIYTCREWSRGKPRFCDEAVADTKKIIDVNLLIELSCYAINVRYDFVSESHTMNFVSHYSANWIADQSRIINNNGKLLGYHVNRMAPIECNGIFIHRILIVFSNYKQ